MQHIKHNKWINKVINLTEIYKTEHSLHQNKNKTDTQSPKHKHATQPQQTKPKTPHSLLPPSPSRLFLSSFGTIFTASLYLPAGRGSRTGAVSSHAAFPRQAGNHSSDRRVRVYGEDEPAAVGHGGKRTQG